jgi:hypothetical protein
VADSVDTSQRKLEGWKHDAATHIVQRDPWIISCESWMAAGKYVALTINPEQLDFSIPLRVARDSGNNCGYMYVWRRRRTRSLNSTMQLSLTLSSGNIYPQKGHSISAIVFTIFSNSLPQSWQIKS